MKQTLRLAHRRRRTVLIVAPAAVGADRGWNCEAAEEQDGGAEDE
jgi:hypothetical protein